MKTERIFVAIKITNTDQIRNLFRQVQSELKDERIKWVSDDGFHITLCFIGTIDIDKISLIKKRLKIVGRKMNCFPLNLQSLGAFPSMDRPRIIWAGINSVQTLFELQKEITKQLQNVLTTDEIKFTPHMTLGRIKQGVKNPERVKECLQTWKDWKDDELWIDEFFLMESHLTKNGAIYKLMERFSLNNSFPDKP